MEHARRASQKSHLDVADELQRHFGLIVAAASVALAPINYVATLEQEIGTLPLWAHPEVLLTTVWAVLAGATALKIGRSAKAVQVAMVVVVMFQAAMSSVVSELTSVLFLGIAIALAHAYGFFRRHLWVFFAVLSTALIAAMTIRMMALGVTNPWHLGQWLIGSMMVLGLYAAIYRATNRWFNARQKQLVRQVDAHTAELREALEHSEQLRERNRVLLREIHHRTRNNLQLISSLLSLEQVDPELESRSVNHVLETARRRVQAMATAHQLLHHSEHTSVVSLAHFMTELTNEFVRSGLLSDVTIDIPPQEELEVRMDFAVPLGLVVSELIANSAEHALSDGRHSAVWLSMRTEGESLVMSIEDQGSEFPEHVSIDRPDTTGLQIVSGLVAQIHGTLDLTKKPHTRWTVTAPFPAAEGTDGS